MTALDHNSNQRNYLATNNFKFLLRRAPNMEFFVQRWSIPGTSTTPVMQPGPFVQRPMPGGPIDYQPLDITFKVAEDLGNWLEMYNWMHGSTYTTNFNSYAALKEVPRYSDKGITSDIVVTILSSSRVPIYDIVFHDAFPISVGEINFASDEEGVQYPQCTSRFMYHFFSVERLNVAVDKTDITAGL